MPFFLPKMPKNVETGEPRGEGVRARAVSRKFRVLAQPSETVRPFHPFFLNFRERPRAQPQKRQRKHLEKKSEHHRREKQPCLGECGSL